MANNRLRYYRLLRDRKQKDMAEILGITSVTLSRYERGERCPDVYTAIRIAKLLDTHVEAIWG